MAWSTRELADLAGTTMRAVRHYHDVGLLEEPRRRANGYKQYGVAHLVRVLRIKRLADLGFTLPQIAELGDADRHPREALRILDRNLARDLDRLQRARVEVRQILRHSAPTDLPPALAARIRDADLSAADRALLIVLTRVLDLAVVIDFVDTLRDLPPSPAATAFDQLPATADDATRHALAAKLLPRSRTLRVMLPRLQSATTDLSVAAARTLDEAVRDLYNPAQSDVLRRVGLLLRSRPGPVRTPQVGVTSARDRVTAAAPRVSTAPQRHGAHSSVITAVPVEHPRKALDQRRITRRSVLTATRGAALTGCGIAATPTLSPAPASVPPPSAAPPDDPDLVALEGAPAAGSACTLSTPVPPSPRCSTGSSATAPRRCSSTPR